MFARESKGQHTTALSECSQSAIQDKTFRGVAGHPLRRKRPKKAITI
jgi:hypothetical protein